jgi:peptidoglycan/xylan/chitin deacetylase (PgdA/CDA1 family)
MHPVTFRARLELLRDRGYTVMALDDALTALAADRLPEGAVVITIDDGWVGTGRHALPLLREFGWPATLYVATRGLGARAPVAEVLSRYMVWRSRDRTVDLASVDARLAGTRDLRDPDEAEAAIDAVWSLLEPLLDPDARRAIVYRFAEALRFDLAPLARERLFELMDPDELAAAAAGGCDVQLHSHSHALPLDDRAAVEREIAANRAALGRIARRPLDHLCYPSGDYHPRQFSWLRALRIRSATTCRRGFAWPGCEPLELPRLLDSEDATLLEFEAEVSGFTELARRGTNRSK